MSIPIKLARPVFRGAKLHHSSLCSKCLSPFFGLFRQRQGVCQLAVKPAKEEGAAPYYIGDKKITWYDLLIVEYTPQTIPTFLSLLI